MRALWVVSVIMAMVLTACSGDEPVATDSAKHAVTAGELIPYWWYHFTYSGSQQYWTGWIGPILSDTDRQHAIQTALATREQLCNLPNGGGAPCVRDAVIGLHVILCPTQNSGLCDSTVVAKDTGWVALMSRTASENQSLIGYLETNNFPVPFFRHSLETIKDWQELMGITLTNVAAGTYTSTQIAKTTHDQLAAMAAPEKTEEQMQLAETRQGVAALEKVVARYQSDLDAVQPAYGDVAARHATYRATEADAFAAIAAIATEASTADLSALAVLKVRLGEQSNSENRAPQLLIVDAKRVLWELADAQAHYEAGIAPHQAYLTENSLPVLDHTSAPRTGMTNVVGYAENRMHRVNDAVRTIYDGIRRREAALSLAAVDAQTRDQLRAADAAQREADFLNDITTRSGDIWRAPPVGKLNLALQSDRFTAMKSFLQLEDLCKDVTVSSTWRQPGCQKVAADAGKVRTYLTQTLPFTLRFGIQKMRTAGFDATVLSDLEAKINAGDLLTAVHLYDAALRGTETN